MSRRKRRRKPKFLRLGFRSYREYHNAVEKLKRDENEKREMLQWYNRRVASDYQMVQDARERARYHSMRLQEIANGN